MSNIYPLKPNALRSHLPGAEHCSRLRSLTWGSELSLLWENLCNRITLQSVGQRPGLGVGVYDLIYGKSTSPTCLTVVPSWCLLL